MRGVRIPQGPESRMTGKERPRSVILRGNEKWAGRSRGRRRRDPGREGSDDSRTQAPRLQTNPAEARRPPRNRRFGTASVTPAARLKYEGKDIIHPSFTESQKRTVLTFPIFRFPVPGAFRRAEMPTVFSAPCPPGVETRAHLPRTTPATGLSDVPGQIFSYFFQQ